MTIRLAARTEADNISSRLKEEVRLGALGERYNVDEGSIELSIREGDLIWVDDADPRVFIWVHPTRGGHIEIVWIGAPSARWLELFKWTTDELLVRLFTVADFRTGLPVADRAALLTDATVTGNFATVRLTQAKAKLALL